MGKDKGQVARQENIGAKYQNTLNGVVKEKANTDSWTLVLGRKNRLQQEGNTTMPHVRLKNSFEALLEEEDLF